MLERSNPASARDREHSNSFAPQVSVVIPARNEEANIGDCLQSLVEQEGIVFEIIVVDDGSTDRTWSIARSFEGVKVISANLAEAGSRATGKNNAVIKGAAESRADWLLFTDADTVHLSGSLLRALAEAQAEGADMLSYSPEQIVVTFAERAVMPIIFAELAAQYPLHQIRASCSDDLHKNDPHKNVSQNNVAHKEVIAANGQYILVRRSAYESVGGHAAIASEILEDVALAQRFRNSGFRVHFRYGGDMVRTRMYRSWEQLQEGWTKNLALLFPNSTRTSLRSLLLWSLAWASLGTSAKGVARKDPYRLAFAAFWLLAYRRVRSSNFSRSNCLLALTFGPPIFAYLMLRSSRAHQIGKVKWKGRSYAGEKR